jgi:hypothetical protein
MTMVARVERKRLVIDLSANVFSAGDGELPSKISSLPPPLIASPVVGFFTRRPHHQLPKYNSCHFP